MSEDAEPDWAGAAMTAVGEYLSSVGKDMATGRYVLLTEAMDIDSGEHVVYQAAGEDQSAWDTLGLIDYARAHEVAALTAHRLNGE